MGIMALLRCVFTLVLGAFSAIHVHATSDPQTDDEILLATTVAHQAVESLKGQARFPILVKVVNRVENSPLLSVVSSRKECLLVINTNPGAWGAWEEFRRVSRMTQPESLLFAAFHEIGHCQNRLNPQEGASPLPPGPDSELNADLYAVDMVKSMQGVPAARSLADHLIRGRLSYSSGWFAGTHNIGARLGDALQDLLTSS